MSMTTELIPAGKFMFEACGQRWHHIKHGEAQYTEPRLPMVKLYREDDVLALVEALEARDRQIVELKTRLNEWEDCKHDGARYYDMSGQERCGRCGSDIYE